MRRRDVRCKIWPVIALSHGPPGNGWKPRQQPGSSLSTGIALILASRTRREIPDPGAYHSAEIEYVFGMLDSKAGVPWRAEDRALSDQMQKYWSNFARSGNPNGPGLAAMADLPVRQQLAGNVFGRAIQRRERCLPGALPVSEYGLGSGEGTSKRLNRNRNLWGAGQVI